jgi:carbon dioxide concentrating mechanism protein CcmO
MPTPSQNRSNMPTASRLQPLGILETTGLTPAMVALDVMEKTATIRVLQAELNDFLGICIKVQGPLDAVQAALEAGRAVAGRMGGHPIAHVIQRPQPSAWAALESPVEYNPLIQQPVVFQPEGQPTASRSANQESSMSQQALGFIETQGFTAVFEAIDTACKAANVQVVGKEKLGGGYVTVVVRGDVAAVHAAIEAGRGKVDGLGVLIAAHVIPRPSDAVLSLLPQL